MIKQFFRQAWTMMKQHKLFTGIYITGTAVSIAMAMTIFVILYIKLGPLYPEENRDRMMVAEYISMKCNDNTYNTRLNEKHIEAIRKESKYIKASTEREANDQRKRYIITADGKKEKLLVPAYVDSHFWKVFNFKFISGRPFTEQEEHNPVAVITASLAEELYADTDIVGKEIYIDTLRYSIVGVVENQRTCIENNLSGGEIFTPIHYSNYYGKTNIINRGFHRLIMLAESTEHCDSLKNEVANIFSRLSQEFGELYTNSGETTYELEIKNHWQISLSALADDGFLETVVKYLYILLAFLFIPALNLCGLISSRMKSRMMEVGVRKAYGATNREIVAQVLWENMLLTLIGAALGFILSYFFVYKNCDWVVTLFDTRVMTKNIELESDVVFNPTIIGVVLIISFVLNIASALLPTLFALKKNIIQSLYHRR
jgi:cell division protein FtsX